jgi:tRNA A-37 threonylcarbamoyl transferase component Bud32
MGAEAAGLATRTLGHYVLETEAGRGGVADVYRAYDSRLHRPVAIKVLHEELREGSGRAQILAEARAASALNHPNICTIYEAGEADGHPYIAMEFVDGKPLGHLIPATGLPVDTAVRYGFQIADGLAHGHEKGVCHGDLTSCNVMVGRDGRVKILDFGLAKRFAVASLSEPGAASLGRGRPAVAEDIRRFGAVLYEMATGMLPSLPEIPSPDLARIAPALRVPIHRSLNAGRLGGYEEISEARDDLRECFAAEHSSPSLQRGGERPPGKLSRRGRWAIATCLALILCGGGVAAWRFRLHGTDSPQRARRAVVSTERARESAGSAVSTAIGLAGDPDVRVWANIRTGIYHCPGTRWYGKTKSGQFMGQAEAERKGYKADAGRVCEK